jgi:50S ribosomal protein L16 3-hydroxylase
MNTQDCFGDFSLTRFMEEHLHRLPLALPGVGRVLQATGTWSGLGSMLAAPDLDVMVVDKGKRYEGSPPTDLASAQKLCGAGCTILVRHAEKHNEKISELASAFAKTFRAPANVHVYATPPGCFGFSWHYDAEDVFIFQTAGEKEYFLRKNTVNPWPLEETIPADMRYERELMPLMRVLLRAGDLLYIPCGYWHRAEAIDCSETALSLALGIMSRSAIDVFDLLRSEVLQSLVWRQRLPVLPMGQIEGMKESQLYERLLQQLADDLCSTLKNPQFARRVTEQFVSSPETCL